MKNKNENEITTIELASTKKRKHSLKKVYPSNSFLSTTDYSFKDSFSLSHSTPQKYNSSLHIKKNLTHKTIGPFHIPITKDAWVKEFDKKPLIIIMTIATLFALYGDDFRLAVLPKSLDDMIYILIFICLLLFTWEFITYCICKKNMYGHFFFG